MRKNVWLINHYATDMAINQGGRHYWFAENLKLHGYNPTIFCANTFHYSANDPIAVREGKFALEWVDVTPFVYVKTIPALTNYSRRVLNMALFYRNVVATAKEYAKRNGMPDVIIASSPHPLTMVAGIRIARSFRVPCICEVRDLWPESLVAYEVIPRNSLLAKTLFYGEKWIYQRADAIVMTWEGGKAYIADKGWDKDITLDKVTHIPNGVMLETFDKNKFDYPIYDSDFGDPGFLNVVYTGSIRKVNNIGLLLDAAKIIWSQGNKQIRFLIYGFGNETEYLVRRCENEDIRNVKFKGHVNKKYIPSILSQAHVNILHNSSTSLNRYGQSQNKLFEYLAAGKCIVQTYSPEYNVCERYNCGISAPSQTANEIAEVVVRACMNESESKILGENARMAAFDFDFPRLTQRLIQVIETA